MQQASFSCHKPIPNPLFVLTILNQSLLYYITGCLAELNFSPIPN